MTEVIRYTAYGYPLAEQDSAGNWIVAEPDSVLTGEWGTLRIEVGATWNAGTAVPVVTAAGTDITTINDVPTLIDSLSFGEPYGELTGQLTLPELSPFDAPAWLVAGANIDIYRVLPAVEAVVAGVDEVPYWHGFVASIETADGHGMVNAVSLQLMGALFGEASLRVHQPILLDSSVDIGTSIARDLYPYDYSRPFNPFRFYFEADTTNIETRHRGSRGQSIIDYVDEMLALAQDNSGQWTISRAYDGNDYPQARKYYLRLKGSDIGNASTPQENYITAGGYGVSLSITQDVTTAYNAVYGEGQDPKDGSRWRNTKYPMLFPAAPAYPDRVSGSDYPVTSSDTDADFTTDVITQLQYALRAGGWPDVEITGTFDNDTETALSALQEEAGVTVTGEIADNAGWDLVWSTGTGTTDISSGYMRPLSEVLESAYYEYAPNGAVIGTSSDYDGRLRVERIIAYGENTAKSRARVHARRIARQALTTPPWSGTITLLSDPTNESALACSRFDIREGAWVRVANLAGGTYRDFYIAGVSHSFEAQTTTLTVSQVPYDLLDLSTKLERNRAAKEDPASSFYSYRTQPISPFRSAVGWDRESGAGLVQPFAAAGSAWTVQKFVGAQYGSIQSLVAEVDSAVPFCLAVFGGSVAGTALDALIADPLAAVGTADGSYPSWWTHPDNAAQLSSWGFVEAWGEFEEAAGYYPGAQSVGAGLAGGSATGVLEDAGSWGFASLDPPFLWLAIYPQTSGTVTTTATMRIAVDE
jgi:hypothetical protein